MQFINYGQLRCGQAMLYCDEFLPKAALPCLGAWPVEAAKAGSKFGCQRELHETLLEGFGAVHVFQRVVDEQILLEGSGT